VHSLGVGKAERMAISSSTVIMISLIIPLLTTLLISSFFRKKTKYWLIIGGTTGLISGLFTLYFINAPVYVDSYVLFLLTPLIIMIVLEIILILYLSQKSEA
jgi:Na+/proline symporter